MLYELFTKGNTKQYVDYLSKTETYIYDDDDGRGSY